MEYVSHECRVLIPLNILSLTRFAFSSYCHPWQTDAALLSLAKSCQQDGRSGLKTLSIISSPDLTDEGLIGYLATTDLNTNFSHGVRNPLTSSSDSYLLGRSLVSLTLVNCPLLTSQSIAALAETCNNLTQLTFRNVDGCFNVVDISTPTPQFQFSRLISINPRIHSFTFSSQLPTLPNDFFDAFKGSNKLQNVHFLQTRALDARHFQSFPSVYHLTISGCPNLGDYLPFQYMSLLQELSYLGRSLNLHCLWRLFNHGQIRKLTLDAAGLSACDHCSSSKRHTDRRQDDSKCTSSLSTHDSFPSAIQDFKETNILSSSLPAWVLAYFISLSPPSLETISLHGQVTSTCMRSADTGPYMPLTFDHGFSSGYAYGHANPSTLFSASWAAWTTLAVHGLLRPHRMGGLFLWSLIRYLPDLILHYLSSVYTRQVRQQERLSHLEAEPLHPNDDESRGINADAGSHAFGAASALASLTSLLENEDQHVHSQAKLRDHELLKSSPKMSGQTVHSVPHVKSTTRSARKQAASRRESVTLTIESTPAFRPEESPSSGGTASRNEYEHPTISIPPSPVSTTGTSKTLRRGSLRELLAISAASAKDAAAAETTQEHSTSRRMSSQQMRWLTDATNGRLIRLDL